MKAVELLKENVLKKKDIKTSYTAADSMPLKVLLDRELVSHAENHSRLIPLHIQVLPTNRCNLNCTFCSCSDRDKNLEIDFDLLKSIIDKCSKLGTKAVTITGGGEPLLYGKFDELVEHFNSRGIKIGLVTNGLLLHSIKAEVLNGITWCRISNDDDRTFDDRYAEMLHAVVQKTPDVDWAFSHVVSEKPNLEEIARVINFANSNNFTHVRLVADLYHTESVDMDTIKQHASSNGIDDSRVVYQGRKMYSRGGDCYIGYLKPLIGPDAKVYACCGVQYALDDRLNDLPEELCLGDAVDMEKIVGQSNIPLDGSICSKCYYMNYNILLSGMLKEVAHKEFV